MPLKIKFGTDAEKAMRTKPVVPHEQKVKIAPGLLLDQMPPLRPCMTLGDVLGKLLHVKQVDLSEASDAEVFAYARQHDLTVVTKDSEFQSLLALNGLPPQLIWIRIGNATIDTLESLLRENAAVIAEFRTTDAACLIIH